MTPPRSEGFVRMPDAEFEAILTRAAEEGAKRALVGYCAALWLGSAVDTLTSSSTERIETP